MQSLIEEAEELNRQISLTRREHECTDHLEIRVRVFEGSDKRHFVNQCLVCGKQRKGPIKEVEARRRLNGRNPVMFDANIETAIEARCKVIYTRLAEIHYELNPGARESSAESRRQRIDLIEYDKRVVEDALIKLFEVHSKEQAVDVALRNLLPLRKELRSEFAAKVNRFLNEEELKAWVIPHLEQDFEVFPEVIGEHLSGASVVIDFLLRPRPHLLLHGFVDGFVGLEVKFIAQDDGFSRKSSRALWQTISYTDSEFFVDGMRVPLAFAALFSNLSFQDEAELLIPFGGHQSENDKAEWRGMQLLANHANVGMLKLRGNRDEWRGWSFSFAAGSLYFSHWVSTRKAESGFTLHDKNLIEKRRIGNF